MELGHDLAHARPLGQDEPSLLRDSSQRRRVSRHSSRRLTLRRLPARERYDWIIASSLSGVGRNVLPLLVYLTLPTW